MQHKFEMQLMDEIALSHNIYHMQFLLAVRLDLFLCRSFLYAEQVLSLIIEHVHCWWQWLSHSEYYTSVYRL